MPDSSRDLTIRSRKVIWREVVRDGAKELKRAHVHLPQEVTNLLDIGSRGDMVSFVIKRDSKHVILTNIFETQAMIPDERDPQILAEQILAEIMQLKGKQAELMRSWKSEAISSDECVKNLDQIRASLNQAYRQLDQLKPSLFRSGSEIDNAVFIESKIESFLDEYSKSFMFYVEDILSRITEAKEALAAVQNAHTSHIVSQEEFNEQSRELGVQLASFKSIAARGLEKLQAAPLTVADL